jgi:hypothetical protein
MRVYVVTMLTHVDVRMAKTRLSYRCVPCHPWCTHRTAIVVKKKTFSVLLCLLTAVIVTNVFILITDNIMKRPVYMLCICVGVDNQLCKTHSTYINFNTVLSVFSISQNLLIRNNSVTLCLSAKSLNCASSLVDCAH